MKKKKKNIHITGQIATKLAPLSVAGKGVLKFNNAPVVERIFKNPLQRPTMSYEEVATAIRASRPTVYREVERGKLKRVRAGRIQTESVMRYLGIKQ